MTAELVGQVSIGQCIPTTAALVASALADINAKLSGAIALQAAITITPPTIGASIQAALDLVASLQATLALDLPGVNVDLTVMLSVIAELNASIAALLALSVTLGTAGVYVFTHNGDARSYGPEMQAQVSAVAPAGNVVHSVTFLATDPAIFEALGKVLLTG